MFFKRKPKKSPTLYTPSVNELRFIRSTVQDSYNEIATATVGRLLHVLEVSDMPCKVVHTQDNPAFLSVGLRVCDLGSYTITKRNKAIARAQLEFSAPITCRDSKTAGVHLYIDIPHAPRICTLGDALAASNVQFIRRGYCVMGVVEGVTCGIKITDAPHVLIGGTTGSGKSVLLNDIITTLMASQIPYAAKFVLIDPKQVELSCYEGSPHLALPVVKGVAGALEALRDVSTELDRRYTILEQNGLRSIDEREGILPRLYVVIDELADLMLTSKKETEKHIVRIAQLGRAAGIHLIIATQRPSREVVTGLIKANIPTVIALTCSNATNSVIMLGHKGAEKLLGKGDAILKQGDSVEELRFQSAFIQQSDIEAVLAYWRGQCRSVSMPADFFARCETSYAMH